ncbi:hypothetical protein FRC02_001934 [Tulasnella sp. 418]|nr:hypothetical protein FRC02_001934 [Tulasnella sp. 418]
MDNDLVKVYTVNGAASGSASSLPDWLRKKRAVKKKGAKRAVREEIEGTIDLIQHFEFPEASNRIKTTRDGHHAVATGTYKPQMRVYDLDQMSLKFERHSDSENVDFIILSDDWTKTLHLQNDRVIEVHNQSGLYYKTRIPRFGRSLAYHYPSCDVILGAAGNEVYRLNLDQGRFMNPLVLGEDVEGVNVVDINPAHQLLAFGTEGVSSDGFVEFWDHRSRSQVGILRLPSSQLTQPEVEASVSVTALSSRSDGLSIAVGTSTGHTLLYDLRSARHFGLKDQGYGLPVKNLSWIEGGTKMAGDGMVISADSKVIKIWDRNFPTVNFASITPATDINHVHHIPASGLIMTANEGIRMTSYYIPQLGPAPKWCSFLDNITEELEDQTIRSVYEDFKFVERNELTRLGLDHLIGTPALKPYMHGYFLSLKLYDTARLISNPFAYAEHRERMVQQKVEKLAESRIRTKKENLPKVNRTLAEKILKTQAKEEKRQAKLKDKYGDNQMESSDRKEKEKTNLLNDPRFKELFENPEFEVDQTSKEYSIRNPSAAMKRGKTAVEKEADESDRTSSDGISHSEGSESSSESSEEGEEDEGHLINIAQPSTEIKSTLRRPRMNLNPPRLVPARPGASTSASNLPKDASFGQRRLSSKSQAKNSGEAEGASVRLPDGGVQISWVPQYGSNKGKGKQNDIDPDDMLVPGGRGTKAKNKRPGVEEFGAGMERGGSGDDPKGRKISEGERSGRTQRRTGVRSGSKNAFRRI